MKLIKFPLLLLVILVDLIFLSTAFADPPEIHCKHFIYGYPTGSPATNDLVIRDLYVLSSNDTTKFADWVCYFLTPHEVMGDLNLERKWRNDKWLAEDETLEGKPKSDDDYKGAYAAEDYDRGHLAPLASFTGSRYASQVNFYSNITPQKKDLNQGPWRILEEKVRDLVKQYGHAWVMTGTLYESDMPSLPNSDEAHKVPSGFWKIVAVNDYGELRTAAFIMGQDVSRNSPFSDHIKTIKEIQDKTGLDFFWGLEDTVEAELELSSGAAWVQGW
jgi:endonuclease G, mitochondrial